MNRVAVLLDDRWWLVLLGVFLSLSLSFQGSVELSQLFFLHSLLEVSGGMNMERVVVDGVSPVSTPALVLVVTCSLLVVALATFSISLAIVVGAALVAEDAFTGVV